MAHQSVRKNRRGEVVSVLVREGLPSRLLPHLYVGDPAIETCAGYVTVGNPTYFLISIYRHTGQPPENNLTPTLHDLMTAVFGEPNLVLRGSYQSGAGVRPVTTDALVPKCSHVDFIPLTNFRLALILISPLS